MGKEGYLGFGVLFISRALCLTGLRVGIWFLPVSATDPHGPVQIMLFFYSSNETLYTNCHLYLGPEDVYNYYLISYDWCPGISSVKIGDTIPHP